MIMPIKKDCASEGNACGKEMLIHEVRGFNVSRAG